MRAVDRPEFMPPSEGGLMRSFGMAVLAHAVLVLALSWGVKWKRDDPNVAVEAELWANAPQQAAPKPVEAPPAPPPAPPAPPPPQPTQAQRDAEIALQREREREQEEKEKARREEAERQKQLAEKRRQQEQEEARKEEARKEQARRADEKRKEEQAKARKLQQQKQEEEKRLAELRQENLKRMQGLAGATGPREATGTAMRSSGPSASYAGRLAAHFQRHVVFPGGVDTIAGNPLAVVQVRVGPTGEIMSARLSKSSGNPAWDEAAVRAIERSERIPPDIDGRYVNEFPVEMRPKR
jgi:colicin import membrane protein